VQNKCWPFLYSLQKGCGKMIPIVGLHTLLGELLRNSVEMIAKKHRSIFWPKSVSLRIFFATGNGRMTWNFSTKAGFMLPRSCRNYKSFGVFLASYKSCEWLLCLMYDVWRWFPRLKTRASFLGAFLTSWSTWTILWVFFTC
jgi:hypothetical protein